MASFYFQLKNVMIKKICFRLLLVILLALTLALIWYLNPRDINIIMDDYSEYQRTVIKSHEGKAVVHIIKIDLDLSKHQLFLTPFDIEGHHRARTTSEFGEQFKPLAAINASFFTPFMERRPWDYYPKSGQTVRPIGLTISQGESLRLYGDNFVTLCIGPNKIDIQTLTCPENTLTAVSGDSHFLKNGEMELNKKKLNTKPYPRSVIGLNADKSTMWLISVEGKQPGRSNGITLATLTDVLLSYGIEDAINLDGGGSATLGATINGTFKILNSPIHTRIPFRQRPVANHLGIKLKENFLQ